MAGAKEQLLPLHRRCALGMPLIVHQGALVIPLFFCRTENKPFQDRGLCLVFSAGSFLKLRADHFCLADKGKSRGWASGSVLLEQG